MCDCPRSAICRREACQRGRVDDMLLREHPGRQSVRRIVVQHGDRGLGDDRAFIHFRYDEMYGAAMDFDAIGERPLMGMQARDRRAAGQGGC